MINAISLFLILYKEFLIILKFLGLKIKKQRKKKVIDKFVKSV